MEKSAIHESCFNSDSTSKVFHGYTTIIAAIRSSLYSMGQIMNDLRIRQFESASAEYDISHH